MKTKKRRTMANGEDNGEGEMTSDATPRQSYAMPEGYEKKTSDLAGFWNQDQGPIHFIPRSARAFDNKTDTMKTSILILGESVGQNPVINQDDERFDCKAGEMIGVWYKPGMVALKDLADVKVFMFVSGEKDTGKPNPMTTYEVGTPPKARGTMLYITEDFRKKSLHTSLPFPTKGAAKHAAPNGAAEDDDENFGGGDTSFP
jgi:hypothetical protein